MNVLVNHCWCSKSNWGDNYDCRVIVAIERIPEGKTYYDAPTADWTNLVEKHDFEWKDEAGFNQHNTFRLKAEVLAWLEANIKDRRCDENVKGWAVGNDEYNSRSPLSYLLFFERTGDAMRFIKQWSSYKKPINYLNYFRDTRRKLDFKTNRLRMVQR